MRKPPSCLSCGPTPLPSYDRISRKTSAQTEMKRKGKGRRNRREMLTSEDARGIREMGRLKMERVVSLAPNLMRSGQLSTGQKPIPQLSLFRFGYCGRIEKELNERMDKEKEKMQTLLKSEILPSLLQWKTRCTYI